MAKLLIYRGETFDREIDLGERNARLGRGDQNDIVLPDPAKAVSRFHAELRFDAGVFTIVDLNSQNGTWVGGQRVQQATLEPGVPVVLGAYRLVLQQDVPADAPAAVDEPDAVEATEATLVASPVPEIPAPESPVPELSVPDVPPLELAPPVLPPPPSPMPATLAGSSDSAATATGHPTAPGDGARTHVPPILPPARPTVPSTAAAAPLRSKPAPPKSAQTPPKRGASRGLLYGGFAALVVIVFAAAVFLTPLKGRIPGLTPGGPATAEPAPPPPGEDAAKPPETPVPPPVAPAAVEPVAAPLPETVPPTVAPAQAAGDPAAATKPPSEPSRGVKPLAAGAGSSTAPAPSRRARETAPAPSKAPNLARMLEQARAALSKGEVLTAIAGLEAVVKADPKYPDAADLLTTAKAEARKASQAAVESGAKSEASGDYAAAARHYERALQLDPESGAANDATRRLKARMQAEGEDAFRRARQYDALGRAKDAIPMYEKAIQLLPADHASMAVAKERLAALKGGF